MLNKTGIYGNAWVDLVFEGRNHEYGAFIIRKKGPRYTALAILFTVLFFGLLLSYPLIFPASKHVISPLITEPYVMTLIDGEIFDIKPDKPDQGSTEQKINPKKPNSDAAPIVVKDGEEGDNEKKPEEKENKFTGAEGQGNEKEGDGKSPKEGTGIIGAVEEPLQIHEFVQELPEFPGGEDALMGFLYKHIIYPPRAAEEEIEGKVKLSFVVERDGSVSNVQIISPPIGFGLEDEAMRVVKILPRFKPGKQNGNPVRVRFMLPVVYKIRR